MKINGVNLGNWLVLEKWMNPTIFEGTKADDEYYLAHDLEKTAYKERMRIHRAEYITERDFMQMASWNINTVRIPIPYFIFGDREPFIGCINELDNAFGWAEKYGIKILIDLHTVPFSQNGLDNGGLSGVCKWSTMPDEVDFVLSVLERLADRYGHRTGLFGIEVINEPMTTRVWKLLNIQERYPARDAEMAAGSQPMSLEFLFDFYDRAYDVIKPKLADDKYIVYHDGFEILEFEKFIARRQYDNIILDTHQYLMVGEAFGIEQSVEGYRGYIEDTLLPKIKKAKENVPVVTGEWSLFNSLAAGGDTNGGQNVLQTGQTEVKELSKEKTKEIYQALSEIQMNAWNQLDGHFYWNYKTLIDTANEQGWYGWDCWDLGRAISQDWFPTELLKK